MTEEFLHYLWRFQLMRLPLLSSGGEPLQVLSVGTRNRDAGPDYLNARIKIGDTLWAGDVEIHVRSSDWNLHRHSTDQAFKGVILHVVHALDAEIDRGNGQVIPSLVLQGRFDTGLYDKYEHFLTSLGWIPCEDVLGKVSSFTWNHWLSQLAGERLSRRSNWIDALFTMNHGHSELSLYHCLAAGFGLKVNTDPFVWLAQSVDLKLVMKYREDLLALEALFFGQAGFLDEPPVEDYQKELQGMYSYLKAKHDLTGLPVHLWKFLRMRPAGFPTVRIAHWAAFLQHGTEAFNKMVSLREGEALFGLFENEVSPYWRVHYHFGKKSNNLPARLGKDAILTVLLNSLIPFRFVRSMRLGEQLASLELLELMRSLPAEENSVVRAWRALKVFAPSALESQALLELKSQYCDLKNCLHCSVGMDILQNRST